MSDKLDEIRRKRLKQQKFAGYKILIFIAICLLVMIPTAFVVIFVLSYVGNSPSALITPTPTYIITSPTPTAVITATPTVTPNPDIKVEAELVSTPIPNGFKAPFIEAREFQDKMCVYPANEHHGAVCRTNDDYKVTAEDFRRWLLKENKANLCKPISYSEVSVGDMGTSYDEKVIGVCLGFIANKPVFLYFGTSGTLDSYEEITSGYESGAFVGYALSETDEMLSGMFPIKLDLFYDTGYGEGMDSEYFNRYWKEEYWDLFYGAQKELNVLYEFSRILCNNDVERFKDIFFTQELTDASLTWAIGEPEGLLKRWSSIMGANEYDEYVLVPLSAMSFDDQEWTYTTYRCTMVSLDSTTFLENSGVWDITICENTVDGSMKVMPYHYVMPINSYIDVFGLSIATDLVTKVDSDGNEYSEIVEVKYGPYIDEEGRYVYTNREGITIPLTEDEYNWFILSEDEKFEQSVLNLKGAGFIVDVNLRQYFDGEFMIDENNVRIPLNGKWYDMYTNEEVGFESTDIWNFHYYINGSKIYMYPETFCTINPDGTETPIEHGYYICLDMETGILYNRQSVNGSYGWYQMMFGVTYYIYNENGRYYLASDELEDKHLCRLNKNVGTIPLIIK